MNPLPLTHPARRARRERSERLAAAVTHLTRIYCARRLEGRPVLWLIARSNKLSVAYLESRELDYASPL